MAKQNKFIIIRSDLQEDPVTIVKQTLLLGRSQECGLSLNHPAVSLAQAGIRLVEGCYFVFGLKPANPIKLNGKRVEDNEALASGDVLELGPFILETDLTGAALTIKVSRQIGPVVEPSNLRTIAAPGAKTADAKTRAAPLPGDKALDFYWDKRIRDAGKLGRRGPLFPKSESRQGKALFNWKPTSDLVGSTPLSFFIWTVILGGVLLIIWAYLY